MTSKPASVLPRWQKLSITIATILLALSGVAWLWLHHFQVQAGPFGPESHPLEHPVLVIHGIMALLALPLFGAMLPLHVSLGWNNQRQKASGVLLLLGWTVLTLTAAALYYLGDETLRSLASSVHWGTGLALCAIFLVHGWCHRQKHRGKKWPQLFVAPSPAARKDDATLKRESSLSDSEFTQRTRESDPPF